METPMPSREEIQRIAGAMNALRPDWRVSSLTTFLTDHCYARSYRALSIAAVAVATDPKCTTPNLLTQDGPWWAGAFQASGEREFSERPSDPSWPFCPIPGHPRIKPGAKCTRCEHEAMTDEKALPESELTRRAEHRPEPVEPSDGYQRTKQALEDAGRAERIGGME